MFVNHNEHLFWKVKKFAFKNIEVVKKRKKKKKEILYFCLKIGDLTFCLIDKKLP